MDRKALEAMLERGQDSAMLRYTLGTLLFKQGEYSVAVEHLEAGLGLDPNHSASWKFLGRSLAELDRRDEAIAALEKGIEVGEARGDIQAVKEMRVFLKRLE